MYHRILLALATLAVFAPFTFVANATAVTAADWRAGRIIDDDVFTDKNDMTVEQVQAFLNKKVGTSAYGRVAGQCDTYGQRTSELGGGTRAQYGASRGNPTPFTCLKDYYEVPKTQPGPGIPASNYGGAAIPAGARSAAQLIWDAAQRYNINPKVLLVTIQKESAGPLTTDDWPLKSQYTYAMGARCPDSGPNGSANCDPNYAGFSIQISESAALLRYYLDNMQQPWWPYKKPFQNNTIKWNVPDSCGAGNVYIETKATAALYTYTPYQPNQAALNNMYGTGDGCSAYGNRNFWRIYNDWFGDSVFAFQSLTPAKTLSGDFNGDGKADITLVNDYGDARTKFWTFYGNGTGYAEPVVTWDSGKYNFEASRATWVAGDSNGDGKADITALYNHGSSWTKAWSFFGNATSFASPVVTWDSGKFNFEASRATWVSGDYNGDGKADITALYNYGNAWTKAWTLSGNGSRYAAPTVTWDSGKFNFDATKATWVSGDSNGDGKADITALYNYGNAWTKAWTLYGNANSFASPAVTWDSGKFNFDATKATWVSGDSNGDGKADITALYNYGNAWTKAWTLYGNANSFASPAVTWDSGKFNFDATKATWVSGDSNGDGKADINALYKYSTGQVKFWAFYGTSTGHSTGSITYPR